MFLCPNCVAYAQEIARLQNQVQILEANARLNWNQNQKRRNKNEDWVNFRCFYCHEKVINNYVLYTL